MALNNLLVRGYFSAKKTLDLNKKCIARRLTRSKQKLINYGSRMNNK